MKNFITTVFMFSFLLWGILVPAIADSIDDEITAIKERLMELEGSLEKQDGFNDKISQYIDSHKIKAGMRVQAWYQYVEDGKGDNHDKALNDFMVRRAYFYIKGQATEKMGFFAHLAADRIGQDGLDKPSVGLGSGFAVRDAWVNYKFNDACTFQFGRMYIPFTRFFGTESTFGLLTLEIPFTQGGVRGAPFFTSKVGRDDGVVIWGNPFEGLLQYRFGVSEGVESNVENPDDNLRFTGRVSVNLLEPEKGWYNKGSYLGKKKVLAMGAGYDYQQGLILDGMDNQNNEAWTTDIFFDYPVGEGAVTAELSYVNLKNSTQALGFSRLVKGKDAQIYYIQAGYLFPGQIGPGRVQPYFRYEHMDVKDAPDTSFPCAGVNYFIKGHSAKFTLDWTLVHQKEKIHGLTGNFSGDKNQNIITFQLAVGF